MSHAREGISFVLPVLNEQDNLEVLHERLAEVLEPLGRDYEVIYVDDGSWGLLKKIAARDYTSRRASQEELRPDPRAGRRLRPLAASDPGDVRRRPLE